MFSLSVISSVLYAVKSGMDRVREEGSKEKISSIRIPPLLRNIGAQWSFCFC